MQGQREDEARNGEPERQTREQIERILKMPFRELPPNMQPKAIPFLEKERKDKEKDKSVRFQSQASPLHHDQNDLT